MWQRQGGFPQVSEGVLTPLKNEGWGTPRAYKGTRTID